MEQEQEMNQEQLEAFWNSKMSEAKKHLKKLSKNELIRTVVNMSVQAYRQQAYIEQLVSKIQPVEQEVSSEDVITDTAD